MKNLKIFLSLIIVILAGFSALLFLPLNCTSAYATINGGLGTFSGPTAENTQKSAKILDTNSLITKLYGEGSATKDYYSFYITNSYLYDVLIKVDKRNKFSTNATGSKIEVKATEAGYSGADQHPRIETAFRIPEKFKNAVENKKLQISLYAKITANNPADDPSTEVGFQNGTISGTVSSNGTLSYNGWTTQGQSGYTNNANFEEVKTVTDAIKQTQGSYTGYYEFKFVPKTMDVLVVFANKGDVGTKISPYANNDLTIEDPTIVLSEKEENGSLAFGDFNVIDEDGNTIDKTKWTKWTNQTKTLTFSVSDDKVGVEKVTLTDKNNNVYNAICTSDANNFAKKEFRFEVNSRDEETYTITAEDILGKKVVYGGENPTILTVGKTDKVGFSNVSVVDSVTNEALQDIISGGTTTPYHNVNVSFKVNFTGDSQVNRADESAYYKLVNTDNGNIIVSKQEITNNNGYKIEFSFPNETTNYALTIFLEDTAGNKLENGAGKTYKFSVDTVKRYISIDPFHASKDDIKLGKYRQVDGKYEKIGDLEFDNDENKYFAYYNERIGIYYKPQENYIFNYLEYNNSKVDSYKDGQSITEERFWSSLVPMGNMDIKIYNRFNVQITPTYEGNNNFYFFNPNNTEVTYSVNNLECLLNNATSEELNEILGSDVLTELESSGKSFDSLETSEKLSLLENAIKNAIGKLIVNDDEDALIYDVGTYKVSWGVETINLYGLGNFNIEVKPKQLNVNLSLLDSYTYNGNSQIESISYNKKVENKDIVLNIYKLTNETLWEINTEFKNAGEYKLVFSLKESDPNYCIDDSCNNVEITIFKKSVTATITSETEFEYDATEKQITCSLDESDLTKTIKYALVLEDGSLSTTTTDSIINVGTYGYTICLDTVASENYEILNPTGYCTVTPLTIFISNLKTKYDYIGSTQTLDFTTTKNNKEGEVINSSDIFVIYSKADIPTLETISEEFNSAGNYYFLIYTTNSNYILLGDEEYFTNNVLTGSANIEKTVITVVFDDSVVYEYTGKNLEDKIKFTLYNNSGKELENNPVIKKIFSGTGTEFINCGKYVVTFESGVLEFNYQNSNTLAIVKAIVKVEVETNYTYNPNGNLFSYKLTSSRDKITDYTNNSNISIKVNNAQNLTLGNAGDYSYEISSLNTDNIILLNSSLEQVQTISGTLKVNQKQVIITFNSTYTYNGEIQTISYLLKDAEDIEVMVEVEVTLDRVFKDAGEYSYTVELKEDYKANYILNSTSGKVKMLAQKINVKKIANTEVSENETTTITYEFNEDNKTVSYELLLTEQTSNLAFTASYLLVGTEDSLQTIRNVGSYNIFITANNSNYIVDTSNILIVINPKPVVLSVVESTTTQTYNANEINVEVIAQGYNFSELGGTIKYFIEDNEYNEVINAGTYTFIAEINNNYYGVLTGNLTISKAPVRVAVDENQSKTYGESDPESFGCSITGLCGEDKLEVTVSRESGENVKSYRISIEVVDNPNYDIQIINGTFNITKRNVYIGTESQTIFYGKNDAVTQAKLNKLYNGYVVTYGLVEGDSITGSLSREFLDKDDVGSYNVTTCNLPENNPNYKIILVSATLKILPTNLEVKLNDIDTFYGTEKPLSYSVTGEYNEKMVTGSPTREAGNDVNTYKITRGDLQSTNYNLIITEGTYTIKPLPVTITALNTTKVYGEEDNIEFINSELLEGETLQQLTSEELKRVAGEDAGNYEIDLTALQNKNPNYKLVLNEKTKVFTITKAGITIEIKDQTQVYGEEEKTLESKISGLKRGDTLNIKLFREQGTDVGEYVISGKFEKLNNYYIESLQTGIYKITQAKINLLLQNQTTTYNAKPQSYSYKNFDFPLNYIYKQSGIEVNEVINAGTYTVSVDFENKNYLIKSNEVEFIVKPLSVCFNLGDNNYIYDGKLKLPKYSYDQNIGLNQSAITFKFEEDKTPIEVGSYVFDIIINNANYTTDTRGIINITKQFSVENDLAILVCDDAKYDANISNIKLVDRSFDKKFNNQQVLQACAFENIEKVNEGHIFTVRMKARTSEKSVYVYKIDKNNNISEVVVSVENGFYVFKVDGLDCSYVITTDIKPMSLFAIAGIIVASIIVIISIVIALKVRKKRKMKLALKVANNQKVATEQLINTTENENANKATENQQQTTPTLRKNERVDDVVKDAINKASLDKDKQK